MLSTVRGFFARLLSTEVGVLGDEVAQLRAEIDALSADYSGHKETTTRQLKRLGMRWARSNGGSDPDILEQVLKAVQGNRGANDDPFGRL